MPTTRAQRSAPRWGLRLRRVMVDEYLRLHPEVGTEHGAQARIVEATGIKRGTLTSWWQSQKRPDLTSLAKVRAGMPTLTVTQLVAAIEGVEIEVRSAANAEPIVDLAPAVLAEADSAAEAARRLATKRALRTPRGTPPGRAREGAA